MEDRYCNIEKVYFVFRNTGECEIARKFMETNEYKCDAIELWEHAALEVSSPLMQEHDLNIFGLRARSVSLPVRLKAHFRRSRHLSKEERFYIKTIQRNNKAVEQYETAKWVFLMQMLIMNQKLPSFAVVRSDTDIQNTTDFSMIQKRKVSVYKLKGSLLQRIKHNEWMIVSR